ncbi:MAG: glycosyltransferase family 4 protein, partial [Fuerstiella sp.]|nr:glycosyltransferase family 4 protein [Fuerstiella sp.]
MTLYRSLPAAEWNTVVGITKGTQYHDPSTFRAEYPDVETVTVESRTGTREGRIRAIQKCVQQVKPDIVLAPRVADAMPAIALLKQQGLPVRLGANVRGCDAQQIADLICFQGFIDQAVGASRLLQQTIRDQSSICPERVFAISSGVPLPENRIERQLTTGRLNIGYIGRLDHHDK